MDLLDNDIKLFLESVKNRSNYDFSNYSPSSLKRRVSKLLSDNHMEMAELTEKMSEDRKFIEKVVKSITVNTTELFRDPKVWIDLKENIIPRYKSKEKISVWHTGSSTGQEVFSMMILLREMNLLEKADIYASDINTDVLEISKTGTYKYSFNRDYLKNFDEVFNPNSSDKLNVPYSKYFIIDNLQDKLKMKEFLVEKPTYQKIDLVRDENLFNIKFDLILCRNVIIYFNYELQNKVFNLFYNNLNDDGCLILGLHESIIGPYSGYFEKKSYAYFKK
jgi:chemotaxis protein methyltransferase CheR